MLPSVVRGCPCGPWPVARTRLRAALGCPWLPPWPHAPLRCPWLVARGTTRDGKCNAANRVDDVSAGGACPKSRRSDHEWRNNSKRHCRNPRM
eukprot:8926403-Lingulodinium_polyedra.AAC.1